MTYPVIIDIPEMSIHNYVHEHKYVHNYVLIHSNVVAMLSLVLYVIDDDDGMHTHKI